MKGIVVFNEANDLAFLYTDFEYKLQLLNQALETGLIQEKNVHKEVDPNVVVQLFMPLVASSRFMVAQVKNAYSSITCENGFTFVFESFGSLLLIGVNGDEEENESFIRRKLLVFKKLIQFYFGPAIESIRPSLIAERRRIWRYFSQLIETWCKLAKSEQSFLVEAVERLHVSEALNAKCVDLLEAALSHVRSGGDKYALHAVLTVNTKLLALYSSRYACEFQSEDLLILLLITKQFFPHEEKLESLFSKSYARPEEVASWASNQRSRSPDGFESAQENSSDEQYFSPRTTPNFPRKGLADDVASLLTSTPLTALYSDDEDGDAEPDIFSSPKPSSKLSDKFRAPSAVSFVEETEDIPETEYYEDADEASLSSSDSYLDYQHKTVFIHTAFCMFTPHTIHSLQIVPGLVLTIVSEVPRGSLSAVICQTLNTLKAVLVKRARPDSATLILEQLDNNIRKLLDATKRAKQTTIDKIMRDTVKRWEMVKTNGFQLFLELPNKGEISHKLENSICSLYDKLKTLFDHLYLRPEVQPFTYSPQLVNYISACMRHDLQDYSAYLAVKAQRNITMTTYLEEFPGLVHFVHINRHNHQMTAPSINVVESDTAKGENMDITQVIKDKIWDVYRRLQDKLLSGYTYITMREGDFLYSYQLWFEDSSGNYRTVQQPFHPTTNTDVPGILTGRFYSNICRQCFPLEPRGSIHCYELMCVHVGIVPTEYVQAHCKRLAALIWETSGEAHTPISLL